MSYKTKRFFLYLAAFGSQAADAGFPRHNKFTAMRDVAEDGMNLNPFFNQDNAFSEANTLQHVADPSKVENPIACLSTVSAANLNDKRNFREAFENGETEQNREKKPKRLPDNLKMPHFSLPLPSSWGDDLPALATEWDNVSNNLAVSPPTEIDYNYSPTDENLGYPNFYLSGGFWEAYDELMQQPSIYDSTQLKKAAEAQASDDKNLGESSHTKNPEIINPTHLLEASVQGNILFKELSQKDGLIFCSTTKSEPPKIIAEKRLMNLENNLKQANINSDENRDVRSAIKIKNTPLRNTGTFHQTSDLDNYQKFTDSRAEKSTIEMEDKLLLNSKRQGHVSRGRRKTKLSMKNDASQNIKKTLKHLNRQPYESFKGSRTQFNVEINRTKKTIVTKKDLKEALKEFKLELEGLKKNGSTENSLALFLKAMDYFADNKPDDSNPDAKGMKKQNYLNPNSKFILFVKSFFDHNNIPVNRSQIDKLSQLLKNHPDEEFRRSSDFFIILINDQIEKNGSKLFYISNDQVHNFFFSTPKNSSFKVDMLQFKPGVSTKSIYCYADKLGQLLNSAVKSDILIPWENIFTSDESIKFFEKRESILMTKNFPEIGENYGKFLKKRYSLRKLFLVYSTIINKIFCGGEKDLLENFLNRQKGAINFFDKAMDLIRFDDQDTSLHFIQNDELPLEKETIGLFLESYDSCYYHKKQTNRFQFRLGRKQRNITDILWKFIALWLANSNYNLYEILYYTENAKSFIPFRDFINSFFLCILQV
ncbi:hypothetical protein BY996DRAFT_1295839 [Phakopsora pachyrhizi]|uniref:Expressed protein n=1 Tax=Phakopsora pachyrhizi TaxID=170000 RepID=A0AAV0B9B6_PHAPC|nr:hypothetical protein BY996DRAFT_1295839 [Phakopsora pachyrhizi]CAH7682794.1 expressed protein [Phakopsora pachyrhizi]